MKTALVCEGGGMRGIFCAGVLDVFLEERYDPFDMFIGVSAGACNLASHLAGQYERNFRLYTGPMASSRFISFRSYIRGGHYMDLDWFWDYSAQTDPLNVSSAIRNLGEREFFVVTTSAVTGMPAYIRPVEQNLLDALKASSAVPVLYRGFVNLDMEYYVDGGISDPIPVQAAVERGADRVVVIRTRPEVYEKKHDVETLLSPFFFSGKPGLRKAIRNRPDRYNEALDIIKHPPADISIWQIAPPETIRAGRTSTGLDDLTADYNEGRRTARLFLDGHDKP